MHPSFTAARFAAEFEIWIRDKHKPNSALPLILFAVTGTAKALFLEKEHTDRKMRSGALLGLDFFHLFVSCSFALVGCFFNF